MRKALLYSALMSATLVASSAQAVEFDGFLTAGFAVHNQGQASGASVIYLDEIKDKVTFLQDSKFGLQVTADVAEDMQVVAQILASAEDENYNMDIEWAYLDYSINDSTSFRMGRIKQPVFLISDYLEVGYAYPWIRPPAEAYSNMPVDSIIGVEFLYQTNIGGLNFAIQPYFGSNTEAVPGANNVRFFADNYIGMALRLESRLFTFQISTFHTDVSTIDSGSGTGALNSEGTALLSVASLSWDVANFIGYAEYTTRDIDANTNTLAQPFNQVPFDALFSDQDGYYVTLGYRMGKYLPHITYATIDSDPSGSFVCPPLTPPVTPALNTCGPSQGARQESITIGLRYEINDSTALKIEFQQVELENNAGNLGLYQPFSTADGLSVSSALDEDKASIISVAVDLIF
jgi:hypothetical protein